MDCMVITIYFYMITADICVTCNPYYGNRNLYVNYIYYIICHGTSLKKHFLATLGLAPALLVSVNRHARHSTITPSPP